ncbi:hypothetical protein ACFSCX_06440 [Bacillus salitolerans]|uniref:Phosphoadenosine phosphosulphate reductase domain-containing protein n=1 Tax=Bacillus salitolerans TaxID=1437434 RepID=A0ABW4LM84_9BACI
MSFDFYQPFNEIKEEMAQLYLNQEKNWLLAVSYGKDSTAMLLLIWEMLSNLPAEMRTNQVHVITSATSVETPDMEAYLRRSVQRVNKAAREQGLPITAHIATPAKRDNYWLQVLGKGNPPVSPIGRFRWCSQKLKINAVEKITEEILRDCPVTFGEEHDAILGLGVRDNESIRRKNSISKHSIDETKFAKHNKYENVLVYHPIKYLDGSQLWGYFADFDTFPWGTPVEELRSFYPEEIFECSIKTDGQGTSCGNGRNGCWVCTAVVEDKMLKDLVSKDFSLQPLYEYKQVLATIRNDARYRMPVKRVNLKHTNKRINEENRTKNQLDFLRDSIIDYSVESQRRSEYELYDRANDTEYNPGSLTITARLLLLRKLLYIEQQTGYELIEKDIIEAIVDCWIEEGYHISLSDVTPLDWQYDGPVVFDENGVLKTKDTTNPHPQFWVHQDFSMGRDEMVQYIEDRVKETGQSFFYYIDCCDLGEKEAFAWNIGYFLVCDESIQEERDAFRLIQDWLYKKPVVEEMDWDLFAERYYQAAYHIKSQSIVDYKELEQINRVLVTLGKTPVPIEYNVKQLVLDIA